MQQRKPSLLPRISVTRPVTVLMILLALLVVGYVAYTKLPIALLPEGIGSPRLHIWAGSGNSNARDSEQNIGRPIEDALGTVRRIDRITTKSTGSGCSISVRFSNGTDMNVAYAEVKDRMDRVMPELPDEVQRIRIYSWDENDIPIMYLAFTAPPNAENVEYLIDQYMESRLQRIEGVGSVDIHGMNRKEVHVELEKDKLLAHGVNPYQLSNRLRNENLNVSGGDLLDSGKRIQVRSVGRLASLQQIEDLVIDSEKGLKIGDVANVDLAVREMRNINRMRGLPSYGIEIRKSSGGNVVAISEGVKETIEAFMEMPELKGFEFFTIWDQGEVILASVDNLKMSGIWGGFFSVVVLWVFLRSPRTTITVSLAIPLSLLSAVVVLYFLGWSLNMVTLMGLLLCVGLVVDNAIVMVENIHAKREAGIDPHRAALDGATEVGLAITMATMTTVVAFLPFIFLADKGEMRHYLIAIGVPVISGLIASLLIALLLMPLATKKLGDNPKPARTRGMKDNIFKRGYVVSLKWVLQNRFNALIGLVLLIASIAIPAPKIKTNPGGGGGNSNVSIWVSISGDPDIDEVSSVFDKIEAYVESKERDYGYESYRTRFSPRFGSLTIMPSKENLPWYHNAYRQIAVAIGWQEKSGMEKAEIIKDLKENVLLPAGYKMGRDYGNTDGVDTFRIHLYGDDTDTLVKISSEVVRRIESVPGVSSADIGQDTTDQELNIRVNREQTQRLGVNARDITGAISSTIRGSTVGYFYTSEGQELNIRLQLKEEDRDSLNALESLTFRSDSGADVPLSELSKVSFRKASGALRREDRKTSLRIQATLSTDDSRRVYRDIDNVMADFTMPRGYSWGKGAGFRKMNEGNKSMKFALPISLLFIVLLMGILFESFVLPLAVFMTFPLAACGVYWFLYLTGTPFNPLAGIGAFILAGVVVNNSIVLVDLANRLQEEGMDRFEALVESGRRRFRPIWMTTLTTMCGMIPMAIGGSAKDDAMYTPLARTIIGGLFFSTIFLVVVIPLFYSLLDDFRNWVLGTIQKFAVKKSRQ